MLSRVLLVACMAVLCLSVWGHPVDGPPPTNPPDAETIANTDAKTGAAMILDDNCDNGQENLTMDWNHDQADYTCYGHTLPVTNLDPVEYCQQETYEPKHFCTNTTVPTSPGIPPLSGAHRPVWPQYGEYKFIPWQRWLHALEHGSIALLYHPCADPAEVQKLREIINGCLWRHIITPYKALTQERPLALLAWGCKIEMAHVDINLAKEFIKGHALASDEFEVYYDGFFNETIIEHSKVVTDYQDLILCPE